MKQGCQSMVAEIPWTGRINKSTVAKPASLWAVSCQLTRNPVTGLD